MNIFLKKIVKNNHSLNYHYNNQYKKILKIIKIKNLMNLHKNNYNCYKRK